MLGDLDVIVVWDDDPVAVIGQDWNESVPS